MVELCYINNSFCCTNLTSTVIHFLVCSFFICGKILRHPRGTPYSHALIHIPLTSSHHVTYNKDNRNKTPPVRSLPKINSRTREVYILKEKIAIIGCYCPFIPNKMSQSPKSVFIFHTRFCSFYRPHKNWKTNPKKCFSFWFISHLPSLK